jgi:hypothetical protein
MSYYGYDWELYVFGLNNISTYLVPIESGGEEEAWKELAKRLSRREELVRQQCKLVQIMNGNSKIVKL